MHWLEFEFRIGKEGRFRAFNPDREMFRRRIGSLHFLGFFFALFPLVNPARAEDFFKVRLGVNLEIEADVRGGRYRFPEQCRDLEVLQGEKWAALTADQAQGRNLHLRYRFPAPTSSGDVHLLSPSDWLVRSPASRYKIQIEALDGRSYVTCLRSLGPDLYQAEEAELEASPLFAFGRLRLRPFALGESRVVQVSLPNALALKDSLLDEWVERTAVAVADYFGKFPVRRLVLLVLPGEEAQISGVTYGEGGPYIVLTVPVRIPPEELLDSWQLCHEMVHLAVPSMPYEENWLEEGLATYLEPLIRRRMGLLGAERFWTDLLEGLPQGVAAIRRQGLHGNHSWEGTYWGGALFCFVADVRLRARSDNRHSLQEGLRAVVAKGGSISETWTFDRFLRVADSATGGDTLKSAYAELGLQPTRFPLAPFWHSLGLTQRR